MADPLRNDALGRRMKRSYALSAITSLPLGAWMVIAPTTFWGLIGINDTDPLVQTIYGGAICGEGIICLLGFFQPLRYIAIWQYMLAYKTVVCLALVPRLALMERAPLAGWVIVVCWAIAAAQAATTYPWGRWKQVLEQLREENDR